MDEFELDLKSDFDPGGPPVRTTAALFYQDCQGIQRVVNANIGTVAQPLIATVIQNAAKQPKRAIFDRIRTELGKVVHLS